MTVWRPVGNLSAISRRLKLCQDCLQPLLLDGDQSPTNHRPMAELLATIKNSSEIDWVAERFHLQLAKPPCDQIVLATFLWHLQPLGDQSATALRPLCNHPTTGRNKGSKEIADMLQVMCDRDLSPGHTYFAIGRRPPSDHYFGRLQGGCMGITKRLPTGRRQVAEVAGRLQGQFDFKEILFAASETSLWPNRLQKGFWWSQGNRGLDGD